MSNLGWCQHRLGEMGAHGIPRHAMPRAWDQAEQLGARQDEIENLRQEEQEKCLGEVCLDADDRESHAGHIAKRVSWERACRVPKAHSWF